MLQSHNLLLINVERGTLQSLDFDSFSDKIKKLWKHSLGELRINSQLSDQNILILYEMKSGLIMVLDLNHMNCYSMEMPFRIISVQAVSDMKWLIHTAEDKYVFCIVTLIMHLKSIPELPSRKFVLEKKSPKDPVPSVLFPVVENIAKDFNVGWTIGSMTSDLGRICLMSMLMYNIYVFRQGTFIFRSQYSVRSYRRDN